jgi:hypothetical protein
MLLQILIYLVGFLCHPDLPQLLLLGPVIQAGTSSGQGVLDGAQGSAPLCIQRCQLLTLGC